MYLITLETRIAASKKTCFNLSRDINMHLHAASHTGEKVIAGKSSGLCELGDEITWQAYHFGWPFKMKVKITRMEEFIFFQDEMVSGPFKYMRHEHRFEESDEGTIMSDFFHYDVPFGVLGKIVNAIILERHLTQFLKKRNEIIQTFAEYDVAQEIFRTPSPEPIQIRLGETYVSSIRNAYPFDPIEFDNYGITVKEVQYHYVDMSSIQFYLHQVIPNRGGTFRLDYSKYSEVRFKYQDQKFQFKFQLLSELEYLEFRKLLRNLKLSKIRFFSQPYR